MTAEPKPTSLILVAITSLIGIIPHLRAGRVRVVAGTLFGLAGVGGSLLGSSWNESVDPDVLPNGDLVVSTAGKLLPLARGTARATRPVMAWAFFSAACFPAAHLIGYQAVGRLLAESVRATGLAHFGILMGEQFDPAVALGDVIELMQKLARERGMTVLMVTHDNRILDIADRCFGVAPQRMVAEHVAGLEPHIAANTLHASTFATPSPPGTRDSHRLSDE